MAPHAVQRASGEVVPERGGGGRSNSHRRVTHAPCRRRRRRFHRWRCGWRSVGQPGERRVWSGDPVGLAPRNGLIVAASITVAVVSVGRSKLVNPLVIPNDWEPWQRRQQRLKRVHVSVAPTVVGHTQVIAVISHVDHDIYQHFPSPAGPVKIPRTGTGGLNWTWWGPDHDDEFMNVLNRHASFTDLLGAWNATGNAVYAKYFSQTIADWVLNLPCAMRARLTMDGACP